MPSDFGSAAKEQFGEWRAELLLFACGRRDRYRGAIASRAGRIVGEGQFRLGSCRPATALLRRSCEEVSERSRAERGASG